MPSKGLSPSSHLLLQNSNLRLFSLPSPSFSHSPNAPFRNSPAAPRLLIAQAASDRRHRLQTLCKTSRQDFLRGTQVSDSDNAALLSSFEDEDVGKGEEVEVVVESKRKAFATDQSILSQIQEIVMFSGPATALWICGPLMSLIDTAVIGQGSSLELAALGNVSGNFLGL